MTSSQTKTGAELGKSCSYNDFRNIADNKNLLTNKIKEHNCEVPTFKKNFVQYFYISKDYSRRGLKKARVNEKC